MKILKTKEVTVLQWLEVEYGLWSHGASAYPLRGIRMGGLIGFSRETELIGCIFCVYIVYVYIYTHIMYINICVCIYR